MLFSGNAVSSEASFPPFYALVQFTAMNSRVTASVISEVLRRSVHQQISSEYCFLRNFKNAYEKEEPACYEALYRTVIKATGWVLWCEEGQKGKKAISGRVLSRLF